MSEWYEAEDDDIDLNTDSEEVNILVKHNDWGNVYVTLTYKQVLMLEDKINSLTTNEK